METNQNPAQEHPAQSISEFSQPTPHSAKPRYNPDLRNCACEARYDLDFEIDARDLTACLDAVRRLSGIVEQVCRRRIDHYFFAAGR